MASNLRNLMAMLSLILLHATPAVVLAVATTGCGNESFLFTITTMKVSASTESITPESFKSEDHQEMPELHRAVRSGDDAYAEWPIRNHADVNKQMGSAKTALHFAVLSNNLSMTRLLIHNGARTDIKDRHGKTPVDYWESGQNIEILRLLMKAEQAFLVTLLQL